MRDMISIGILRSPMVMFFAVLGGLTPQDSMALASHAKRGVDMKCNNASSSQGGELGEQSGIYR